MLIDVKKIDITPVLVARQKPVMMLKREVVGEGGLRRVSGMKEAKLTNLEEYWILQHKLPGPEGEPKWSVDKSSDAIRIPMFDYLIADPSIDVLIQFGAQTAALASALLPKDRKIRKFILVFGNAFQRPDNQPGYQTWAGFAICFEK